MAFADDLLAKLQSVPTFKPTAANVFTDWSVQAGDIITVDGHQTPVFSNDFNWSGSAVGTMEASGNKQRPTMKKIERQQTATRRGAGRAKQTADEALGKWEVVSGSQLWQQRDNIVAAAGEMWVYTDPVTGEHKLRIKDGTAFEINQNGAWLATGTQQSIDLLGQQIAVLEGSQLWIDRDKITTAVGTISTINGQLAEITGSTLWQQKDNITAAVGTMSVDSNGKLHIVSGSGLLIDGNGTSHGIYTDGNLTAGVLVNKINGGTVKIQAKNIELNGSTIAELLIAQDVNVESLGVNGSIVCEDISTQDISDCYINDVLFSTHSHKITVDGGKVTFGQVVDEAQNFNIADTQFYKDGVSAARTSGFNQGRIEYFPDNVLVTAGTYDASTSKLPITVIPINEAGEYIVSSGYIKNVTISGISSNPSSIAYESGKNPTWASNGKSVSLPLDVLDNNGASLLKQSLTLNTTTAYDKGFSDARLEFKPDNIVYVGGTTEWQSDGKKITQTLRAINEAGQYLFEKSYSVDTTTAYNKGYGDGRTDFRPTVIGYQSGQLIEWADDGKSCVLPLQARNINGESLVIRNMTLGTSNAYNKGYSDGQDSKNVTSVSGESISYSNLNQRLALTAIAKNSSGTVLKRNNIYLSTANVYQYSEWTTAKPADLTGWTEVNVFNSLNGTQTKYEKCLKIVVTDYMNRTTTVYNSTQAKDYYIHTTQVTANTTKRYYKPSVCDFRNIVIE